MRSMLMKEGVGLTIRISGNIDCGVPTKSEYLYMKKQTNKGYIHTGKMIVHQVAGSDLCVSECVCFGLGSLFL